MGRKNAVVAAVAAGSEEVSLAQAIAESVEAASAEPKVKPAKIVPLASDAAYIVTAKGRAYAEADVKLCRQRPDAGKAGSGKDWYDLAERRPARRQQLMRLLVALHPHGSRTGAELKDQVKAWLAEGRISAGSENAHVLLGLCHACGYIEAV